MELACDSFTYADSGLGKRQEPARDRYRVAAAGSFAPAQQRKGSGLILLREIRGLDRRFRLRRPLPITVNYEDDGVSLEHRSLPVQGFASSLVQALREFSEMFEAQYAGLAETEEDELSESAIEARRELLALVESAGA